MCNFLWHFVLLAVLALREFKTVAEPYQVRTIRLIMSYAPSGPTDMLSRIVAKKILKIEGASMVIKNWLGATDLSGAFKSA